MTAVLSAMLENGHIPAHSAVVQIDDIPRLQEPEILAALRAHSDVAADQFVLANSKQTDWPLAAMAEQLQCRQKFKQKLPQFLDKDVLCTAESFEQSSSWYCAQHKAALFDVGSMLDLCGGLGVDSMAFAAAGFSVSYNDIDPLKAEMFKWNTQQLDMPINTIINKDAFDCLNEIDAVDYIFIDPSRRSEGKRQRAIQQFQPDLAALKPLLHEKAQRLILKLAPQTNLSEIQELFPGIQHGRFISLDGEAKECLIDIDLRVEQGRVQREAHCLRRDGSNAIVKQPASEEIEWAEEAQRYMYIPDPSVVLAGLSASLSQFVNLRVLSSSHVDVTNANAIALTGDSYCQFFPGRVFEVIAQQELSRKSVNRYLRQADINQAHVWRCQSKASVADLRKMLGLKDGGDNSCLVLGLADGRQWFIHARRC